MNQEVADFRSLESDLKDFSQRLEQLRGYL